MFLLRASLYTLWFLLKGVSNQVGETKVSFKKIKEIQSQMVKKRKDHYGLFEKYSSQLCNRGWHVWMASLIQTSLITHHSSLSGHELEQALIDGEGQGSLASCSPWGCKGLDTTEWLNNKNPLPQNLRCRPSPWLPLWSSLSELAEVLSPRLQCPFCSK